MTASEGGARAPAISSAGRSSAARRIVDSYGLGSVESASAFVGASVLVGLALAAADIATMAIPMIGATAEIILSCMIVISANSVHVQCACGRQWLTVSSKQRTNIFWRSIVGVSGVSKDLWIPYIHNFGNSGILGIFSKYRLRGSVRIHCIHRTSSGTSRIRPIRI